MDRTVRVLLISGSTRAASGNTATLMTVRAVAPSGMDAVPYEGLADLPAFNPDQDGERPPRRSRPYGGRCPRPTPCELYGKPVAWINVAAAGRGEGAVTTLATVLGYLGAVVIEPACVGLPVDRGAVGPDGLVADPEVRAGLVAACQQILRHFDATAEG